MTNEYLYNLVSKHLTGTTTNAEEEELKNWINKSESNKLLFNKIKIIWTKLKEKQGNTSIDLAFAKEKIRNKIMFRATTTRTTSYKTLLRIAASIIILLGVAGLTYYSVTRPTSEMITYLSGNEIQQLILPDSSEVWLNTNSKLMVPKEFTSKSRKVVLEGEGYFIVKRDETKPFKIKTDKTTTEVLGTSFNINQRKNNDIEVTVETGKVAFYKSFPGISKVVLVPGERGKYLSKERSIQKDKISNINYLAWKTKTLIFSDSPIEEVCLSLSKYYNKNITFNSSDTGITLTAKFEDEELERVLDIIEFTLNLRIEIREEEILIFSNDSENINQM